MTIKRFDHVSVVVDDLPGAIAFFTNLGMEREGEMPIEGPWVDRVSWNLLDNGVGYFTGKLPLRHEPSALSGRADGIQVAE